MQCKQEKIFFANFLAAAKLPVFRIKSGLLIITEICGCELLALGAK